MPVETDGRRSLVRESGAPSRSTVNARRSSQDQSASACDSTTRTYRPSSVQPRVSSSLLRGLRYAILLELVGAGLVIGAWLLVGFLANYGPTAVVILGGLVLVGLVVVRGTASS